MCSTKKKRQLAASVFHHLTQEQTASGPSGATQNSNLVRMVELATKQRFAVNARRVSSSACFCVPVSTSSYDTLSLTCPA